MTAEDDAAAKDLFLQMARSAVLASRLDADSPEYTGERSRSEELLTRFRAAREAGARLDLSLSPQLLARMEAAVAFAKQQMDLEWGSGEVIVTSQDQPDEDIGKLTAQVARKGFAGLTPFQILIVVLVVLAFTGVPVAELKLPPELQALTANEPGYIALAIALTSVIVRTNRK